MRSRATARSVALLTLCGVLPAVGQSREGAPVSRLRSDAVTVARMMIDAAGHRLSSPVYLQVAEDSLDVVAGGFAEALVEAGFAPRRGVPEDAQGSILWVRRVWSDSAQGSSFDVRIERMPERAVLYSRILTPHDSGSGDESDGPVERMVVPTVVAAVAALIIYLFFTVRS